MSTEQITWQDGEDDAVTNLGIWQGCPYGFFGRVDLGAQPDHPLVVTRNETHWCLTNLFLGVTLTTPIAVDRPTDEVLAWYNALTEEESSEVYRKVGVE